MFSRIGVTHRQADDVSKVYIYVYVYMHRTVLVVTKIDEKLEKVNLSSYFSIHARLFY
jgi:hypothetical protein